MKKRLKEVAEVRSGYRYSDCYAIFQPCYPYYDYRINRCDYNKVHNYYQPVPEQYLTAEHDIILKYGIKWEASIVKKSESGQVVGCRYIIIRCYSARTAEHLYQQIRKPAFLNRCRKSCRDGLLLRQIIRTLDELIVDIPQ